MLIEQKSIRMGTFWRKFGSHELAARGEQKCQSLSAHISPSHLPALRDTGASITGNIIAQEARSHPSGARRARYGVGARLSVGCLDVTAQSCFVAPLLRALAPKGAPLRPKNAIRNAARRLRPPPAATLHLTAADCRPSGSTEGTAWTPARLGCLRRGRQGAAVGRVLSRVYVRMQPHKHRTAAREGGAARARGETSGQRRQMRARAPPLPPASRYWHTRRRAWRRASSRWSHVGGTRTCGTVWWPCRALPPAALLQTCWDGSRGDVTGAVGHTAQRARARLPPLPFCCVGDRGER